MALWLQMQLWPSRAVFLSPKAAVAKVSAQMLEFFMVVAIAYT